MNPSQGGAVGYGHGYSSRSVAQLIIDLVGDLPVCPKLESGVGAAWVGIILRALQQAIARRLAESQFLIHDLCLQYPRL